MSFHPAATGAEQLLAFISHELGAPLATILACTHILEHEGLTAADRSKALRLIQRSAEVQTRFTRDLQDMASVASGQLSMHLARIDDVSAVIDDVVDSCAIVVADKRLRITSQLERPLELVGDRDRLHQVVDNILRNAVKFTPADGTIQVTARGQGDSVQIAVRDSGPGMTAADLMQLFKPFSRGSAGEQQPGMGLGLAVARQIVEQHAGRIEVFSEGRDRGATFTVHLPRTARSR